MGKGTTQRVRRPRARPRPLVAKVAAPSSPIRHQEGSLSLHDEKKDMHNLDEARTLVTMARWAIEHGHPEVAERSLHSASRIFEAELHLGTGLRAVRGAPNRELVKLYLKYFEEAVAAYMLLSRLQRAREGKENKRKAADLSEIAMRIRSWYEGADSKVDLGSDEGG